MTRHEEGGTATLELARDELVKPILILGAARSGTALLSSLISAHPDVAFWGEPSYIWKMGQTRIGHDMIPRQRATTDVQQRIRERFVDFCHQKQRARFCEKTPANALRLPFVMEVLPDAKIIHIIRDGRDVAVSARKKALGNMSKITRTDATVGPGDERSNLQRIARRTRRRIREGSRLRDLMFDLPKALNMAMAQLGLRKTSAWGPRFPGQLQLMASHSLIEVAAIQWRTSVEAILNAAANHPHVEYHELKYEELLADPVNTLERVFEFAELEGPGPLPSRVAKIVPATNKPFDDELTPHEKDLVLDQIAFTLRTLGYELAADGAQTKFAGASATGSAGESA